MVKGLGVSHRKGLVGTDALLDLGQVDRRQRRVEVVVDLIGRAALTVGQARELLGVTDKELLLITQAVVLDDHPSGQVQVSREIQLVVGRQVGVRAEILRVGQLDVAFEEGAVDNGRINAHLLILVTQGEVIEVGPREVDASGELARSSRHARPGASVEVAQPGVLAQPADDLQVSRGADSVDEGGLGEVGVSGQVAAQCLAVVGLPGHNLGIVVGQADALGISLGRAGRLHGVQVPGRTLVHVDDRQQRGLQPPQGLLGRARPIAAKPGRPAAVLGQVGRVEGQDEVARAVLLDQRQVDRGEIGGNLEVQPHRTLAVPPAVAGQLGEIDTIIDTEK